MASGSEAKYGKTNAKTKARIAQDGTVKQQRQRFAAKRTAAQGRSPRRNG